ncbi:hypothetical protein ILUMI_22346 [Ignelater luminosus]|uniref:General transcription factor 3C polypeptide 3 n=1 Tax=Ignelater luminosus TaxID=2038154 RepID=A0A8K0FXF8_IGNLU|nr:hypothetical protein ILUMI_22346 [Ignelater luminosus]
MAKLENRGSDSVLIPIEDLPLDIEGMEPGPSTSKVVKDVQTSKPSTKIIDKYFSGEIPLDDYEMLLDEEHNREEQTTFDADEFNPKPARVTKRIPPHIKALIGEANLRFARGELELAEKMCYEIIRQHWSASEPYITLAQIFEQSDPTKCLEYYMVAALCSPRNVNLWVHCAQLLVNANKINQAIFCYTNAVRVQPKNIKLHLKRIQLLRMENDNKNMLRSYVKMMQYLTPAYYKFLLEVAVKVAYEYHQLKEYKKAIDALNIPFQKCPSQVTLQMVNIMLELLLLNENYSCALDIFLEFCNIEIEILVANENKIEVVSYKMPEQIQIDLRIKFIICVIKLQSFHLLDDLLKPLLLMEDEVENIGDLFLDVIEALMAAEHYQDALKLLVPLIKTNNYSLAGVWLKYADCQRACGMYEPAIDSYRTVMRMAPLHLEVKYNLAEVLAKLNKKNEALAILHQDPTCQEIDINLLMLKIKLLKELEELDEYWKSVELMLSRHCETLRHYEEIRAVTYLERPGEKIARVKKLRQFRGETLDVKPTFVCTTEPSVEEEYELFRECIELCMQKKKFALMQKFVFTALTSQRFKNKYEELGLLGFFSSFYNRDSYHAYPLIREIVIHYSDNNLAWNLFNVLLQRADDLRHTRFMMRFLSSYTQKANLRLLEANYCLTVGNIKIGLGYYLNRLRNHATPLTCLLLGCLLLYIFGQKFTANKEKVTKTAIALFLKYSTMRSKDAYEEINYNLGRVYQNFGLVHLAKHYYTLVLEHTSPLVEENPNLSLKREAAYNLHIIYKNSGNLTAARNLLLKYIRV